jgi:hypothetical protein
MFAFNSFGRSSDKGASAKGGTFVPDTLVMLCITIKNIRMKVLVNI